MKKMIAFVSLRLNFDPQMDTQEDVEKRIKEAMVQFMATDSLSGCEHGAQLKDWKLEVGVAEVDTNDDDKISFPTYIK